MTQPPPIRSCRTACTPGGVHRRLTVFLFLCELLPIVEVNLSRNALRGWMIPPGGRENQALSTAGAGQRILSAQTDMWPGTGAPPGDVTLRLVGAKPPLGVQWR